MSTTKTREALSAMRSCIKSGEPWTQKMEEVYIAASYEVRAIESVAMALNKWNLGGRPRIDLDAARAWGVLESIAARAPEVRLESQRTLAEHEAHLRQYGTGDADYFSRAKYMKEHGLAYMDGVLTRT